jgi:hypothetical protein
MSDDEYTVDEMLKIIEASDEIVNNINENKSKDKFENQSTPVIMEQTIDRLEKENIVSLSVYKSFSYKCFYKYDTLEIGG